MEGNGMGRIGFAALAGLLIATVAAAETIRPAAQAGFDRPGGTYATLPTEDADSCAAQCAKDGLCLAWSYQGSGSFCALKAVITPASASAGAVSGLAGRAPGFAALVGASIPAPARAAQAASPRTPANAAPTRKPALPVPDDELLGAPDDPL
jgi:hypothetical protein